MNNVPNLKVGDVIVVISSDNRQRPSSIIPYVGTRDETTGTITNILPDGFIEAVFPKFPNNTFSFPSVEVMLFEEFKKTSQYKLNFKNDKYIFNKGDVVYLYQKLNTNRPGPEWPVVGSPFETDMKVLSSDISEFRSRIMYTCYVPEWGASNYSGQTLISANERFKLKYKNPQDYILAHDIYGVINKGSEFMSLGEYMVDKKTQTISIFITPEVLNSFTKK